MNKDNGSGTEEDLPETFLQSMGAVGQFGIQSRYISQRTTLENARPGNQPIAFSTTHPKLQPPWRLQSQTPTTMAIPIPNSTPLPSDEPLSAGPIPTRNNTISQTNSNSGRIKRRKFASASSSRSRVPPSPSSAPTRGSVNTTARKALYDRDGDCCFCCGNEDTGQACHVLPGADFKRVSPPIHPSLPQSLTNHIMCHPDSLRFGTALAFLASTRWRIRTTSSACARTATNTSTATRSPRAGCSCRATSTSSCAGKPNAEPHCLFPRYFSPLHYAVLTLDVLTYPPQGYPGTYTIFVFVATSRNLSYALSIGRTRTWGGSPTAALLKAGMSIAQVATGTDPLGVPEEVLLQWIKLRTAYQRRCNPPAPAAVLAIQAATGPGGACDDTPTAPEPDVESRDDQPQPGSADADPGPPPRGGDRGNSDAVHAPVDKLRFDPASPHLVNRSKPVRDAWVFGPSMSVDQIVNKLKWCRG